MFVNKILFLTFALAATVFTSAMDRTGSSSFVQKLRQPPTDDHRCDRDEGLCCCALSLVSGGAAVYFPHLNLYYISTALAGMSAFYLRPDDRND